jgi:hypothetical protein
MVFHGAFSGVVCDFIILAQFAAGNIDPRNWRMWSSGGRFQRSPLY